MTRMRRTTLFAITVILCVFVEAWELSAYTRRGFAAGLCSVTTAATSSAGSATAAAGANGLAEKLLKRDTSVLTNSVFNLPPPAQIYPPFMRGSWDVNLKYSGYLFPSQRISRERLTADVEVPGFQKCSIAALCDVGKESVSYTMVIDPQTGLEERQTTLATSMNAHLDQPNAVRDILYNPKTNPNRVSIVFEEFRVTNAERIEIFCNGRESELIQRENVIFVCSEYIRQVTFGTGSQGVPRQIGTNYAHFWTWKQGSSADSISGNLLTAGYLDPQDALFFEEPSKPVAVYSHLITATRRT